MGLSRDEIITAIAERKHIAEALEVDEWGGTVYIRLLSPSDLKGIGFFTGDDPAGLPVRLLVACLADEDGAALFTRKDLQAVGDADFATVIKVFEVAAKVNGLTNSFVREAAESFEQAQDESTSTA